MGVAHGSHPVHPLLSPYLSRALELEPSPDGAPCDPQIRIVSPPHDDVDLVFGHQLSFDSSFIPATGSVIQSRQNVNLSKVTNRTTYS